MTGKRKRYSADFKAKVALEALRDELTTAQLATKHGIHQTMVGEWKKQAMEGLTAVFSDRSAAQETAMSSEAEVEKLHAKIGQLLVEGNFWRKPPNRQTKEPPAMSISMIGLDTAKTVFQLHGVDETGRMEIRRKLRRNDLITFFEKQAACTVVMEACGAALHWARMLTGLGHSVKLIAPEAVKPFVKKGKKNDAADAAAICEAAARPDMKFVPAKSLEQQGILALHAARSLLVKQQTKLANAMRGLATEFGLTVPKGIHKLDELMALVDPDETVPKPAKQAISRLHSYGHELSEGIETFEAEIVAHARRDETARRLATIPGIGPITSSLIAATVGDITLFKTARQFAAWLGLVPRQNSSGGKTRLGRITEAGNREIRKLLVLGATSMVFRADGWNSAVGASLRSVLERRPVRLVTVALANKMARIVWSVMTRKEVYRPKGGGAAVVQAAA